MHDAVEVSSPGSVGVGSSARERPWLFAFLIAPMALLGNGLIAGALSLLLRQQGTGMARAASIVSLLSLPQMIYFLWSPITDFWVRRRTWLMLGSTLAAVTVVAAFYSKALASPAAVTLLFLSACFGQLVVAACGGMMGALRSEAAKRQASSFYQGGSLAFGAVGIFILAMLAERMKLGPLGWIIGFVVAAPSLVALAAPEQEVIATQGFGDALRRIGGEFRGTFLRWEAIPYTLAMLFPMGSGAAIGLLPGLAVDYHVSSLQVAWMNGFAGTALTALGALAATLIPVKVPAPVAYLLTCLLNEVTLGVLWLGPQTPATYFLGATLYLFTVGTCYAMFTAVVLEFLGHSGKSGSTRYSLINSLGNVPVAYMTFMDGWGYARWGPRGLPAIDALLGFCFGLGLLAYFLRRGRAKEGLVVAS